MDDFGIEYVGERHIHHFRDVLKQHYEITEDWTGPKFGGINIKWNYAQIHSERTCRICIKDYIKDLLLRFGHKALHKPQLSMHKHCGVPTRVKLRRQIGRASSQLNPGW